MRPWMVVCAGLWASAPQMAAAAKGQGDVNLALRGGVGDYTGELSELSAAGPMWGATLNLQPYRFLGFELSYDGSRNALLDKRIEGSPALLRHGGSALIRVSPPFIEKVRPFVGGGFGASFINAVGSVDGLYQDDIVEEVPLVAGIEFNSEAITAGVRGAYRWLLDESFAEPATPGSPQGGILEVGAAIGLRF